MSNSMTRATSYVHYILRDKINKGDLVVDATMGNGNDTLFLAGLVGKEGRVFAFDIQELALDRTLGKINDNNLSDYNIRLINDSHENIGNYLNTPIDGAMFNLGYLPGGDHSIITKPTSTIEGIKSVLRLLKPAGIISIILYYGHEGGEEEKVEVINYLEQLPSEVYTVMQSSYLNRDNNPPIVVFIEKIKRGLP